MRAYTAQIVVGDHDRGCSGVLVEPEWLLTAASCFADNPAASLSVSAGKPGPRTTATIGRTDLSGSDGAVREVVQLVPRSDCDMVLARLNRPVTNVLAVGIPGEAVGTAAKAGATNAAITTYQPGQGGLPAAGARFGCAAR